MTSRRARTLPLSTIALVALTGGLLPVAPAAAGGTPAVPQVRLAAATDIERVGLVAGDTVTGAPVTDTAGRDLGIIDRLLVEPDDGWIAHVIVGTGGLLGLGRDLVQVSWQDVELRLDQDRIVAVLDRAALDEAPDFQAGMLLRDRDVLQAPAASPPLDPAPGPPQPDAALARLVSVADITGSEVLDPGGVRLGSAHRLMIDPGPGRIAYVVIATDGFLGVGRDHVQIPWGDVRLGRDGDQIVLTAEQPVLERAPAADGAWIGPVVPPLTSPGPARPQPGASPTVPPPPPPPPR
jgi:sporulation protein YlmC with PRC-barrel domain